MTHVVVLILHIGCVWQLVRGQQKTWKPVVSSWVSFQVFFWLNRKSKWPTFCKIWLLQNGESGWKVGRWWTPVSHHVFTLHLHFCCLRPNTPNYLVCKMKLQHSRDLCRSSADKWWLLYSNWIFFYFHNIILIFERLGISVTEFLQMKH